MKKTFGFGLMIAALLIGIALHLGGQQFQQPGPLQGNEANAVVYLNGAGQMAVSPLFTFDGSKTRIPTPVLGTVGTKPTCAAGVRGALWYTAAAADAADTVEACVKAANNTYAWTALY